MIRELFDYSGNQHRFILLAYFTLVIGFVCKTRLTLNEMKDSAPEFLSAINKQQQLKIARTVVNKRV